jgi:hypothetical protein
MYQFCHIPSHYFIALFIDMHHQNSTAKEKAKGKGKRKEKEARKG